ncbi:PAP2 family phosphoesterase [Clostridia bacterium]|nr:PAP2 family phosphoesterase [Clostridia bacterium]
MKDFKKTLYSLWKSYGHALLLLYLLIYVPWFAWIDKASIAKQHVVHMALDDYIPFVEYFIIPYMLWFFYVAVTVIYLLFTDKEDFKKLCCFLFVGMTIFLIVSTVYPNGQFLRPSVFARDNVFVSIVEWLWKTDSSTSLFPSIHTYNSIGVYLAIRYNERLKKKKWVQYISFVLMVSIILATMFLKQHSVFDVLTAIALGVIMYVFVYGNLRKQQGEEVGNEIVSK